MSHKSDDKDIAQKVARTIAKCGLTVYLDILDPNVNGDRSGIGGLHKFRHWLL